MVDHPPTGRHRGDRRPPRSAEIEDVSESSRTSYNHRLQFIWRNCLRHPLLRRLGLRFLVLSAAAFLLGLLSSHNVVTVIAVLYLIGILFITTATAYGRRLLRYHPIAVYASAGLLAMSFVLCMNRILDSRYTKMPVLNLPAFPQDLQSFRNMLMHNDSSARAIVESLNRAFQATIPGENEPFEEKFSIIIAARDEDNYLSKTIRFTIENTPASVIQEIIVVDDASTTPQADLLNSQLSSREKQFVRVIRFDNKQGLIRARITGADAASAQNIFFLDGHCKPKPGWHRPLFAHLKENYKRIACPTIQDIKPDTWEDAGTSGTKMMFSWNFEFDWYDDESPEVPISAGGILAMTKRWWQESGKYDPGMREWGGENLEQSMRVWMCGGEIYVAHDSFVGHIFERPAKPNPGGSLVRQVQTNQKRAALVWLDDYYSYFEQNHPVVKTLDEGPGIEERLQLRKALGCKNFEWYVNRFRTAFQRKGMLYHHFHHIKHRKSGWCLTAGLKEASGVSLKPCLEHDESQKWQPVAGGRMFHNQKRNSCLDKMGGPDHSVGIYPCDWSGVFKLKNANQFWLFEGEHTHHLFTYNSKEHGTLTGHDPFYFPTAKASDPTSQCLASDFDFNIEDQKKMEESKSWESTSITIKSCDNNDEYQEWDWLW